MLAVWTEALGSLGTLLVGKRQLQDGLSATKLRKRGGPEQLRDHHLSPWEPISAGKVQPGEELKSRL